MTNPVALRFMQRHLLANPAGDFSVQKFYDSMKSQGIPVGKDTLHAYLAHFEDAFLIRTVSIHAASERQRMVNARKVYPIDPGLIPLYERTGRVNLGHALETVVCIELERRGYTLEYLRTSDGYQVDFLALADGVVHLLLQVSVELHSPMIYEREVRSLLSASTENPGATPLLITLDSTPPNPPLPQPLRWIPAASWLLDWAPEKET